jgi:hypothetical protein
VAIETLLKVSIIVDIKEVGITAERLSLVLTTELREGSYWVIPKVRPCEEISFQVVGTGSQTAENGGLDLLCSSGND